MSKLAVYIASSPPRQRTNSENTNIVKIRMFEGNRHEKIEKCLELARNSRENVLFQQNDRLLYKKSVP